MKSRNYYIFFLIFIMVVFYGCKTKSFESTASETIETINVNSPYQKDKEELLDMALEISGETLEPDKRTLAIRMLSLNENDLIRGLAQWLILLDGKYPDMLEPKVAIKRAEKLYASKYDTTIQDKEQTYDIFFASTFYDKLVHENKEVIYYGEKVAPKDKGKILIRWKIKKDKYRVIFGNLHAEDVSSEKLAELET